MFVVAQWSPDVTDGAGQTIREAAQWARSYKYHNQCDNYLASLTELLIIMSRFVGTVNPAFGTSSVESIDVRFFPSFIYPHRARAAKGSRSADITGVSSAQDIDFAALYKAYDDELMAWKSAIDERHKGEKTSKGPLPFSLPLPLPLPVRLRSGPPSRPAPPPRAPALTPARTDPAIVMEITLIHWSVGRPPPHSARRPAR